MKTKYIQKWEGEEKAIKAIQVAFDLDEQVQYIIRKEALDLEINPSERIRQLLGLSRNKVPKRPRLSISLMPKDFEELAVRYKVEPGNRKQIKQLASLELQKYTSNKNEGES